MQRHLHRLMLQVEFRTTIRRVEVQHSQVTQTLLQSSKRQLRRPQQLLRTHSMVRLTKIEIIYSIIRSKKKYFPFTESVFIVNDDGSSPLPTPIRQIATVDDEVILIDDEPDERVHVRRVTAVVDLCSPDSSSSNRRKRSHSPGAASRKMSDLSESMDETMAVGGMSCPVCMEKIKNGPPHSTICGHIFCGCCIKRAVGEHKKCPICNKRLTIKGIHPLYFT